MNRRIASILSIILFVSILFGFRDKGVSGDKEFRYDILERLPAHYEGREQPLSSVAASSLSRIHGNKTVFDREKAPLRPIEWLCLTVFGNTEVSNTIPVFKIQNSDIRSLVLHRRDVVQRASWMNLLFGESEETKLYSYQELSSQFPRIQMQSNQARETPMENRTHFQNALIELTGLIDLHRGLSQSAVLDESPFAEEIKRLEALTPAGRTALESRNAGNSYDHESFDRMMEKWYRYDSIQEEAVLNLIPSAGPDEAMEWRKFASILGEIASKGKANDFYRKYAILADAYRENDPDVFNQTVLALETLFQQEFPLSAAKASFEHEFESWRLPRSTLAAFLVSLFSVFVYWMRSRAEILIFSYWLSAGGFLALTIELACRSKAAGIAPVFGFYATSILLAWCAALIGLALQRKYWNGLSLFAANAIASTFLAIAILTANEGPTIRVLPVDIASNALTLGHVSMLTLGYACSLLTGSIGILYFAIAIFTKRMDRQAEDRFGTISYRLISMSTGFVVVGTLLGCLWAQEAFGRFWAWGPKESSNLLIILWNSIMLHAHWGGFAKPRSFLAMAVFGNILCGFSIMGVDLFTIGFLAYDHGLKSPFTFLWFSSINLAGLFLAAFPRTRWKSQY